MTENKKQEYSKPCLTTFDTVERLTKDVSVASEDGANGYW